MEYRLPAAFLFYRKYWKNRVVCSALIIGRYHHCYVRGKNVNRVNSFTKANQPIDSGITNRIKSPLALNNTNAKINKPNSRRENITIEIV